MRATKLLVFVGLGSVLLTTVIVGPRLSLLKAHGSESHKRLTVQQVTSVGPAVFVGVPLQPDPRANAPDDVSATPAESQVPLMLMDDSIQANEMSCDERADDCPAEFSCVEGACVPSRG